MRSPPLFVFINKWPDSRPFTCQRASILDDCIRLLDTPPDACSLRQQKSAPAIYRGARFIRLLQKRADILGDAVSHLDGETAPGGNVEVFTGLIRLGFSLPVERDLARAGDDLHTLRGIGAEVVGTGIDEPERFLGAIREEDGMADDFAVEINVGLGEDRDVGELSGE